MLLRNALIPLLVSAFAAAQGPDDSFRVQIENSASSALTTAAICTVPPDLLRLEDGTECPTWLVQTEGEVYAAVVGEAHGSASVLSTTGAHHVELVILGTFPASSGVIEGVARPWVLGPNYPLPPFQLSPLVASEPEALIPKASVIFDGEVRAIEWDWTKIEQSPASIGERIYRIRGSTGSRSPIFHAWAESRVRSGSGIVEVSGGIRYSDPNQADHNLPANVSLSYSEPVSWHYGPQFAGEMLYHAEEEMVWRGQMVYTEREEFDGLYRPTFLDGVVRARLHPDEWDGHLLVHGSTEGDPKWRIPSGPYRNRQVPEAVGGAAAFSVQAGVFALYAPNLAQIQFSMMGDNDTGNRRGQRYTYPDGSPLRVDGNGAEYAGTFHNSRIDFRLSPANFGKRPSWENNPKRPWRPVDHGHIAESFSVLEYVLHPTTARRLQFEAQSEALMGAQRTGNKPDRYSGRPWSTAAQFSLILSEEYETRLTQWVAADMTRIQGILEGRGLDMSAKVWPGNADSAYAGYIPNPPAEDEYGNAICWGPWQLALHLKGTLDWIARDPSAISPEFLTMTIRMAEAVVLEGYYHTDDGHYLPYYATSYDGGRWLNHDGKASDRGHASVASSSGSYRLQMLPAVHIVRTWGTDPDAKAIAEDIWTKYPARSWDDQKWHLIEGTR